MIALAWLGAALASLALSIAALNLFTWSRGLFNSDAPERDLSILIPARDEAATIADCVRGAAAQPASEILVYDDGSTDGTSEILAGLAQEIPHLRVLQGSGLPDGWVGKPHACHQLGAAARGARLLFVDADTVLQPGAVPRITGLMSARSAQVLTAVPRQITGSPAEHLMLPILHLTYVSWLPLFLIHASQDPRFLAANGQVLAFERGAYDAIGGFEAVRAEVVDDMAICRLAKSAGHRVVFADGFEIARCRMYTSARQVWEGFSKNLYEGLGGHLVGLVGASALYGLTFVLPYGALIAGLLGVDGLAAPGAVGVAANLLLRGGLALRFRQRWWSALAHPLGILGLLAIALNSWSWARRGQIRWSGRVYAHRSARGGVGG